MGWEGDCKSRGEPEDEEEEVGGVLLKNFGENSNLTSFVL